MSNLIDKDALVAEIERKADIVCQGVLSEEATMSVEYFKDSLISFLATLEVKEADNNTSNIRFPHYKSIVEKVFGAGNLEPFEYDEAEQLVLLAKEELLKDLEMKEVDLDKEIEKCLKKHSMLAVGKKDFTDIAKHFFELGLRSTITEEDCKLIWTIGDDIPYMAEEEFYKELLKRYKAQKGE